MEKRGSRFSALEKRLFARIYHSYKAQLEVGKTNRAAREKNDNIWSLITKEFNDKKDVITMERNTAQLRKLLANNKQQIEVECERDDDKDCKYPDVPEESVLQKKRQASEPTASPEASTWASQSALSITGEKNSEGPPQKRQAMTPDIKIVIDPEEKIMNWVDDFDERPISNISNGNLKTQNPEKSAKIYNENEIIFVKLQHEVKKCELEMQHMKEIQAIERKTALTKLKFEKIMLHRLQNG